MQSSLLLLPELGSRGCYREACTPLLPLAQCCLTHKLSRQPVSAPGLHASPVLLCHARCCLQELGQQLADVAANGELQEAFSYSLDGRTYHVFRVEFGGGTAGRFGAAMEVRCVTVAKVGHPRLGLAGTGAEHMATQY